MRLRVHLIQHPDAQIYPRVQSESDFPLQNYGTEHKQHNIV